MTVKEIAALAGVSIGTVDRVVHRRGRVAAETRAKIEAIIEKHQFTPDPIARRLKRHRAYRFCALIARRDQDAGYWGQVLDGIQAAAGEIRSLGVETEIIEFDRYDTAVFQNAANEVLRKKPDGVVFAPIMPAKTKNFIKRVQNSGIPYVFIDADIPRMKPLCAIGQDPFRGGYLAGRLMHLLGKEFSEPVAVLDAHGEDYHITRRRDGFLSYAGEHSIPTITREYSGYTGSELSEKEILVFLKEQPHISGIFITNCLAHRVASAVKKLKIHKRFIIIGYDLIPNNRRLLKEGSIDAIISQRPGFQGREAVLNLYRRLVLEQEVPSAVEIPLDVYIKENVPAQD
jgi:LacI family transcriptional regulator